MPMQVSCRFLFTDCNRASTETHCIKE